MYLLTDLLGMYLFPDLMETYLLADLVGMYLFTDLLGMYLFRDLMGVCFCVVRISLRDRFYIVKAGVYVLGKEDRIESDFGFDDVDDDDSFFL